MSAGTILSPLTNLLKFPEEKENIVYLQICGKTLLDLNFIQDKLDISIYLSWDKIRESLGRMHYIECAPAYQCICFPITCIRHSSMGCFALSVNVFWFIKPTNTRVKKIWTKKKSSQETESEDKLPRVHPSKQEGLKHRLINSMLMRRQCL